MAHTHSLRTAGRALLIEALDGPARVTPEGSTDSATARERLVRDLARRGLVKRGHMRGLNTVGDWRLLATFETTAAGRAALADHDARAARDAARPMPRSGIRGRTVGLAMVCGWLQMARPDGELAALSRR